ncbi:MAG TPA: glutamate formimidoyltransferase [Candidatus Ozemobacteraceae bacterium]|nr:glutamate formimidoyltransferase [Candidatus Ozemobacteraceae bacterium]
MEIIESIINISEGQNKENVDYIVDSIKQTPGCFLLDYSSDADHNRTVITFIGNRQSLMPAVKELYKRAIEKIDLRSHKGEHPRMGAVDVVPFVPIQEITMEETIAFSVEVAKMIHETYKVPVYLYEESQKQADRKNLAAIRKGEFEGLPEKMKKPEWKPDFGECAPHSSAGASVVGARMPLIAFNVNIGTSDIKIADRIAKAVRGISGGLSSVKAMGVELKERNIVQISMNMVNYKKSPLFRVFEMIKSEAERWGVPIVGSEIIGLVPQDALFETAEFYLRCENYAPTCVLENKINGVLHAMLPKA